MRWYILGGLAAGALVGSVAFFGAFASASVCSRCGAIQETTEWQVPCTSIPLFSRSSVHQTPVSRAMTTNRIAPPHNHQWVFAQGGGNGVLCALGKAHIVQFSVESSEVAEMLAALERYGERGFMDKVLTHLFDDSTTHLVRTLTVPPSGFTNAAQLHAWISEESVLFDEMAAAIRNR